MFWHCLPPAIVSDSVHVSAGFHNCFHFEVYRGIPSSGITPLVGLVSVVGLHDSSVRWMLVVVREILLTTESYKFHVWVWYNYLWFGVATYQNTHGLTLELVTNNVHVLYCHNLIPDYLVTMVTQ